MPGRLHNKTAIITGASSGIGRAIALAFASEGASLVCADLHSTPRTEYATDASPASTTVEEAQARGARAIFVKCNTTSSADMQALIQKTVKEYGRLDIMANNAGISVEASEHGMRPVWDIYGLRAMENSCGYITSKHAVLGLTKASALDCAPHRIHVNALCPGYTATAFISGILGPGVEQSQFRAAAEARHPFKGLGTPQDVARAAVFLASEDAAWVTGVGLPVDGGFSCM
ncbi:short-chain dehydrogenase/reductase-like protein [Stemphylium lycopersici]|nr:short-chain dehydrogenase [Stemphylium lycopersici]RAR02040.1 short-chain dehydrogenase/reductase-like protein [Stemphylium lycopersici]